MDYRPNGRSTFSFQLCAEGEPEAAWGGASDPFALCTTPPAGVLPRTASDPMGRATPPGRDLGLLHASFGDSGTPIGAFCNPMFLLGPRTFGRGGLTEAHRYRGDIARCFGLGSGVTNRSMVAVRLTMCDVRRSKSSALRAQAEVLWCPCRLPVLSAARIAATRMTGLLFLVVILSCNVSWVSAGGRPEGFGGSVANCVRVSSTQGRPDTLRSRLVVRRGRAARGVPGAKRPQRSGH